MTFLAACGLLLLSAFLSATLLPGSSEAVLIGLLASGTGSPALLITVASLGNIAGSAVNWGMGRYLLHFKDRPWFPLKDATNAKAQAWFARYGTWSLLFAWVPVIGDPLTLIAGIMQVQIGRFLLLVAVGKVLRYSLIVMTWQLWATV
ncbi:DedA family protein [Pseudorhodobacter turbinis]|uniref:DedA family protein n=1 Tax=Pseudorhodobacter turbinis TaxID=2500533 RepID=A0A4P8EEP6_9RHOB|nr:YqaA family protein [Pseudorhodobacter turbinis]QCO55541.1 DedA family protein [Pseudorhodobacter turbinis]